MRVKCAAVDQKASLAAEKLHRQFLKQLLHIRKSTASEIVLADLADIRCKFTSGNRSCVTTTEF